MASRAGGVEMRMRVLAAVAVVTLALAFSTPAFAQYVGGTPPSAGRTSNTGGGDTGDPSHSLSHSSDEQEALTVRVSGENSTAGTSGLPVTGADILQLVVVAGVCSAGGVVLVYSNRRRTSAG